MTGTGFNNGEDLQIVRYEPGQFYKVHHDQNTAVWAPQGPRVLTFFMYLNTPEGGGETWFPQARADDLPLIWARPGSGGWRSVQYGTRTAPRHRRRAALAGPQAGGAPAPARRLRRRRRCGGSTAARA